MMSAGSWILMTAMSTLTTTCIFMYYRVFSLRHSFDIAARSPTLFCLTGLFNLLMANAVLLHLVLLLEAQGLPCYAAFWPSYAWYALSCTPYCLRALRLVVVYNTKYRLKFARFVKTKALARSWALSAIGIFAYAAGIFANMQARYARGNYGCFFFHEKLVLEIGFGVCIVPASFLMAKLAAVNDVYGIRPEIMSVFGVGLAAGALQCALLELVAANILRTTPAVHAVSGVIVLSANLNGIYWRVVPSSGTRKAYHSAVSGKDSIPSQRSYAEGEPACLSYAREGGVLATLFGDFCRRCLCEESWEFIVEAVAYEESSSQLHEQHSSFIGIVDKYLKPTSPQEINISDAMRASVTKVQTIDAFTKLDEEQRRGILEPPVLEISRMLEQNLFNKFRETPGMRRWLEQQRREKLELEQAEKDLEGDGHMLALLKGALASTDDNSACEPEPSRHG